MNRKLEELEENDGISSDDLAILLKLAKKRQKITILKKKVKILMKMTFFLYWATNTMEMFAPTYMVVQTTIAAKVAGVSGATVITTQPLMLVAVPTLGAMFFCGCSTLFPNTTVGYLCEQVGYGLSRPMRLVELGYNAYIAPIINMTLGIPTVLNLTQQMFRGPGLNATEAVTLLTASQKQSLLKAVRKQGWEIIKSLFKAGATI